METSNSDATHAALQAQNGRGNLGPIQFAIRVQKSLFCMQKAQMRAGTHRD